MKGVSLGKSGEQSQGLEARVNLEKETCQVVNSLKLSYQESQDWSDKSLFTMWLIPPHLFLMTLTLFSRQQEGSVERV